MSRRKNNVRRNYLSTVSADISKGFTSALLDESAFLQQNLNIRAPDLFQEHFKHFFLFEGQRRLADRLLVDGVVAGTQYLTHIVLAAPDLRHTAVDVKQRVDRLHNLNQITAKVNAGAFRSYNFEDMIDGQKKIYEQLLSIARKG